MTRFKEGDKVRNDQGREGVVYRVDTNKVIERYGHRLFQVVHVRYGGIPTERRSYRPSQLTMVAPVSGVHS